MSLSFFAESHFKSLIAQNPFFIASKNTNSVFSKMMSLIAQNHFFIASKNNSVFSANDEVARPRMLKNFFLSEKMLLNAILRVKAQKHEKCFFLMKWNVFCNAEDRFSWVWGF